MKAHLDDEHVDDSDVLDVLVLHKLESELLLALFRGQGKVVLTQHPGNLPPPRLVQRQGAEPGLVIIHRQKGFNLTVNSILRNGEVFQSISKIRTCRVILMAPCAPLEAISCQGDLEFSGTKLNEPEMKGKMGQKAKIKGFLEVYYFRKYRLL